MSNRINRSGGRLPQGKIHLINDGKIIHADMGKLNGKKPTKARVVRKLLQNYITLITAETVNEEATDRIRKFFVAERKVFSHKVIKFQGYYWSLVVTDTGVEQWDVVLHKLELVP